MTAVIASAVGESILSAYAVHMEGLITFSLFIFTISLGVAGMTGSSAPIKPSPSGWRWAVVVSGSGARLGVWAAAPRAPSASLSVSTHHLWHHSVVASNVLCTNRFMSKQIGHG
jgi:hypothetical protein